MTDIMLYSYVTLYKNWYKPLLLSWVCPYRISCWKQKAVSKSTIAKRRIKKLGQCSSEPTRPYWRQLWWNSRHHAHQSEDCFRSLWLRTTCCSSPCSRRSAVLVVNPCVLPVSSSCQDASKTWGSYNMLNFCFFGLEQKYTESWG